MAEICYLSRNTHHNILPDPRSIAGLPVVLTVLMWRGYRPMVQFLMYALGASLGHPWRHQDSRVVERGLGHSILMENAAKPGSFCWEFPTTIKECNLKLELPSIIKQTVGMAASHPSTINTLLPVATCRPNK